MARTLLEVARDDYVNGQCSLDDFERRAGGLMASGEADRPAPRSLQDELSEAFSGPMDTGRLMVLPPGMVVARR